MKESNLDLAKKLASYFNKEKGIITYSGTLAIELALLNLNLKEGSKVLIPNNVCYSILSTIIKLKYQPVIVCPENDIYLTNNDITKVLDKIEVDCIIIAHQYGIINDLENISKSYPSIKIIEDVAQLWLGNKKKNIIGKYSDIVVTSFGKTKPLSYGIGGAMFFNNNFIINNIDFSNQDSRNSSNFLFSYIYPQCDTIDVEQLICKANNIIDEQINNVKCYIELLNKQNIFSWVDDFKNEHVWNRFVLWINDDKLYEKFKNIAIETKLQYQLPHEVELNDLEMARKTMVIDNRNSKKNIILLRTKEIDIEIQLECLESILKMLVK